MLVRFVELAKLLKLLFRLLHDFLSAKLVLSFCFFELGLQLSDFLVVPTLHLFNQRLLLLLESLAHLLHFLEVCFCLLQVLSQDLLLLAPVSFAHLQLQLKPLAILSQLSFF